MVTLTFFFNLTKMNNIISGLKIMMLYLTKAIEYDILAIEVYVVLLALSIGLNILFYFYFYRQVRRMENEWNKDKIYKFGRSHKWIEANVATLLVGDIIKLNSKHICPADVLLLDSSEVRMNEKIALVNERKIAGIHKMTRKFPINDKIIGEDNLHKELKNIMNGTIEYARPGLYAQDPIGTFKIKGDPKVRNITQDNIIYAGSKIASKS
jgi:magnesium-transporting ATPase (P-type)